MTIRNRPLMIGWPVMARAASQESGSEELQNSSSSAKTEQSAAAQPLSSSDKLKAVGALLRGEQTDDHDTRARGQARPDDAGSGKEGQAAAQDSQGGRAEGGLFDARTEGREEPAASAEAQDTGTGAEASGEAEKGGSAAGIQDPKGLTLESVAETLDTDTATLYKNMKIKAGDGSEVTLQAIKDAYDGQAEAQRVSAERDIQHTRREASLTSDLQALGLLDVMQQLPAGAAQKANDRMMQMAETEYTKFLAVTPELQNDGNRIAFENDSRALLKAYDLTPEHFGVRTLGLHRLMQDMLKAKSMIADLTKPKAQQAPKPVKRGRVPPVRDARADVINRAKTGSQRDKISAVSVLIGAREHGRS